jgi:fatty-acid desaturase
MLGHRSITHRGRSIMSWSEWFLAVIATIAVGVMCFLIDAHDHEVLQTPEITIHGHSSTN